MHVIHFKDPDSNFKLMLYPICVLVILPIIARPYGIHSRLVILVENSSYVNDYMHQNHHLYFTTLEPVNLLQLDATNCNEFSTGGSVIVSGIERLAPYLYHCESESIERNVSFHFALVSSRCIRECLMLQSILKQCHKDVLTVSIDITKTTKVHQALHFVPIFNNVIDQFLTLYKSLNWNRIGLIIDSNSMLGTRIADYMKHVAKKISVLVHIELVQQNLQQLLNEVEETKIKVFVLLTNAAPRLLCAAYKRGMTWPDYGWMLYGYSVPDINVLPTCAGSYSYLERTVFPTYYTSPTTEASLASTAILMLQKATVTAAKLNVDIQSALLKMTIPIIPTNNTLLSIQEDFPHVYFVQLINATPSTVATVYNNTVLQNSWLQEDKLPAGRLPVMVNTVYPAWLGVLEAIVCSILITLTLILYIYYRNEPEVKATSWSLSLLMFLGCYLMIIYVFLLTLRSIIPPTSKFDLCAALVWTSGLGVSYILILAVILVKLARVYRIFYHYSHIGKLCSDTALAAYVFILLSPILIQLIVFIILGPYKWSILEIKHTDHTEIQYICSGDLTPYYAYSTCHILALTFSIALVAIKTRKLRQHNFRDTKKVNIFIFLVLLTGVLALTLYKVTSNRGLYLTAYTTLHITHCTIIVLCLAFLFLPKLYPIVYKKIYTKLLMAGQKFVGNQNKSENCSQI